MPLLVYFCFLKATDYLLFKVWEDVKRLFFPLTWLLVHSRPHPQRRDDWMIHSSAFSDAICGGIAITVPRCW